MAELDFLGSLPVIFCLARGKGSASVKGNRRKLLKAWQQSQRIGIS